MHCWCSRKFPTSSGQAYLGRLVALCPLWLTRGNCRCLAHLRVPFGLVPCRIVRLMSDENKRSGMAIASLVLGILSVICFGVLAGIPAIILGHVAHRRARKTPDTYGGPGLALAGFVLGYASILVTLVLAGLLLPALAQAKARAQRIACVNNLKQIGLAFRVWALDHQDRFPFEVPAKEGGTMEPSAEAGDAIDPSPARVFQVLSNELANPAILVCPADPSKRPALNFASLYDANVSYEIGSGPSVKRRKRQEVLARCPIHGNVVLSDGSVQQHGRR
jgi:hypothetical protein